MTDLLSTCSLSLRERARVRDSLPYRPLTPTLSPKGRGSNSIAA